jgi:transposase-like protein
VNDGRHSKLTEPRVEAVLLALEMGCTRRAAAGAAGIHHSTLYEWINNDPTFSDEVEKAEDKAEATYLAAVANAVPKSWQAAAWWLERRKHQDYAQKVRVDVKIDLRAEITKLADELGLDPDAAIAEAEAIYSARR